ncbi:hypothetical protein RO21_11175 [[Actinobacillus] muris]|uniref:Uncharacterized protein n=1 Tax=Muribacter muris TaxID=67855 RepID=A0A0J5P1Z0_9PAST|nr:hypothetical protein [Muribacter muris]KMK50548.1 hypothetical protein RO21_11175 [[Actinobacillus] muris] [Muribacter muris]
MGDVNNQYFHSGVNQVNGINVENQTKIEIHQHFFSPFEREKLHQEIMALRDSDPVFFKMLQNTCTRLYGSFMFVKLKDEEFRKFYEIKNVLFSMYQDKEKHRLSLTEEKAKVVQLKIDLATAQNRVADYERELSKVKRGGVLGRVMRFLEK